MPCGYICGQREESDSQSNWIRKPMTECAIIARPILPRSAGPPAPSSGSDNTLRDAPDRPGAKPLRTRCGRYSLSLINIHDLPLPTNGELAATTDRILRSSFGNNSAERRRLARGVYILGVSPCAACTLSCDRCSVISS